ncbi:MAG TPA: arsenate reductase ArsC [Dissulfurispiraceae bacterium]|nr:arsenate reductase ArsC [Dissulfurispiraceae bacterium]
MDIQLVSRPDCPATQELLRNISIAMNALGVCSDALLLPDGGPPSPCPHLLVDGSPVFSCFPKKEGTPCPICGAVPDIPDTEIIRWHLARALGRKTVLFICSGNAVRSQMAEAIVNHALGEKWAAFSCGIMPMQLWKPVIQALQEIGIDANGKKAKHIDLFLGCRFDLIISLCSDADGFCTAFPGEGVREHIPFEDPMTSTFFGIGDVARTRKLCDEMRKKIILHLERHP